MIGSMLKMCSFILWCVGWGVCGVCGSGLFGCVVLR